MQTFFKRLKMVASFFPFDAVHVDMLLKAA